MRRWLCGLLPIFFIQPAAAGMPDLLCHASKVTIVDGSTLETANSTWSDIYRFSSGKLLISSPGRKEYLYGIVRELEPSRFVVGYMTLLLDDRDEHRILVIHADKLAPKVIALVCSASL